MAVTFPLSLASFWEAINFANRPAFTTNQYQESSMDGGGNVLVAQYGQPKWTFSVKTVPQWHSHDIPAVALVNQLVARRGTFFAYDTRRPFPKNDPKGLVLAARTITIETKGANNRSIGLQGFTASFQLSVGDMLSVTDGAGKFQLLEVSENAIANGLGKTPVFEVQPFLATWIAVGQTVTLIKPPGKFRIVPATFTGDDGSGNMGGGFSFQALSVPA
ncbi:hypothetical protein JJB09_18615 [Rhizobium sp. KVB221]|uniref:Uncharacterized protein n=1 Tax=Rhizobium setariae TaxID=2801340 RepID=A0A936YP21_9HYPH|nr:hypothetical protein [Rhizobium setariae]MBL0374038.1 hypothetical protein [Rhizobium setariae]